MTETKIPVTKQLLEKARNELSVFGRVGRLTASEMILYFDKTLIENQCLRKSWEILDQAISDSIHENDQPNRVFRDGRVILEGEGADLYYNHLMLIRRLARETLASLESKGNNHG